MALLVSNPAHEPINAAMDTDLSLRELAGAAGLSPQHFAAAFRCSAGISPHRYVLRKRIAAAERMLGAAPMSIAEVALDVIRARPSVP